MLTEFKYKEKVTPKKGFYKGKDFEIIKEYFWGLGYTCVSKSGDGIEDFDVVMADFWNWEIKRAEEEF